MSLIYAGKVIPDEKINCMLIYKDTSNLSNEQIYRRVWEYEQQYNTVQKVLEFLIEQDGWPNDTESVRQGLADRGYDTDDKIMSLMHEQWIRTAIDEHTNRDGLEIHPIGLSEINIGKLIPQSISNDGNGGVNRVDDSVIEDQKWSLQKTGGFRNWFLLDLESGRTRRIIS